MAQENLNKNCFSVHKILRGCVFVANESVECVFVVNVFIKNVKRVKQFTHDSLDHV